MREIKVLLEAERWASAAPGSGSNAGADAGRRRLLGIGRCLTALSPPQNGACDLHRTPLKPLKGPVQNPGGLPIPPCTIRCGRFDSRLRHSAKLRLRSGRMDRSCARDETPEGSRPAFAGDAGLPLCGMTTPPALAPSSCTRPPRRFPSGALPLPGGRRADPVSSGSRHGGGRAAPPGIPPRRPVRRAHRFLSPSRVVHA